MSEKTDARFYGMTYVIAGRMLHALARLGASDRLMHLWSVRNYLASLRRIR